MSENIRKRQRAEAAARLRALEGMGMHPNVLREFEESGRVNYSEGALTPWGPVGILYWLDGSPELESAAARFEEESGSLVYHALLNRTSMGSMLTLLYVSRDDEEWGVDRAELAEGRACAYVCNLDDPQLSEYGGIAIEVAGGGIVRTA